MVTCAKTGYMTWVSQLRSSLGFTLKGWGGKGSSLSPEIVRRIGLNLELLTSITQAPPPFLSQQEKVLWDGKEWALSTASASWSSVTLVTRSTRLPSHEGQSFHYASWYQVSSFANERSLRHKTHPPTWRTTCLEIAGLLRIKKLEKKGRNKRQVS